MLELRAENAGDGARPRLRALAAEFPGALRELDSLPTLELERRARACDDHAGAREPWVAWMARYHELMRAALTIRRGEAPPLAPSLAPSPLLVLPPSLALAFARPPGGRLNPLVFAQLSAETGVEPRTLADTLFPPRGKSR